MRGNLGATAGRLIMRRWSSSELAAIDCRYQSLPRSQTLPLQPCEPLRSHSWSIPDGQWTANTICQRQRRCTLGLPLPPLWQSCKRACVAPCFGLISDFGCRGSVWSFKSGGKLTGGSCLDPCPLHEFGQPKARRRFTSFLSRSAKLACGSTPSSLMGGWSPLPASKCDWPVSRPQRRGR